MSQSRVQISNGVIYNIWQDDCRNVRSADDDDAQLAFFSPRDGYLRHILNYTSQLPDNGTNMGNQGNVL